MKRRLGRGMLAALLVLGVLWAALTVSAPREAAAVALRQATALRIDVGPEPGGEAVTLDADLYLPNGSGQAPAVVLAHRFGGSKSDSRRDASRLAAQGYVVLAYTSRGFATSGGRVHLIDPTYEVADASRVLDTLARQPRVLLDGRNDPRVALVGTSYGGALALMGAAADPRVDSVVATATWNDLASAFFPSFTATSSGAVLGPYKQLWGANFLLGSMGTASPGAAGCGRFDNTTCRLFVAAAESGVASPELRKVLHRNSPRPTLGQIKAPVYLIQGMGDTLFGIDQSEATADALRAAGTPVAVRWINGGHDTAPSKTGPSAAERTQVEQSVDRWLAGTLRGAGRSSALPQGIPSFAYAVSPRRGQSVAPTYDESREDSRRDMTLPLTGREGTIVNPPGGVPAAITTIPGGDALAGLAPTYSLAALPGQHLAFDTSPTTQSITIAGSPSVRVAVTSTGREVTLFASLWQVQGNSARLLRPLVAPVRVAATPGQESVVTVDLPPASYQLAKGTTLRILLSATDSGFRGSNQTRVDTIHLAQPDITLPVTDGTALTTPALLDREARWIGGLALLALLAVAGWAFVARRVRSRRETDESANDPDETIRVDGLRKTYGDGHHAVDGVTWSARRGQVVGLLGPNGAGKTTTLRLAVGLIHPDAGETRILGRRVQPGDPVLSHVGALIEGPGFVPHLTGRANLHAYWAATGRPASEAGFDEVLDVAALGGALDRPVKSYSHGMKQRLGIAQAMLGRPELLILDEPTNGLDPPQIAALRPILQRYAATGRTVVVSSHLLAEVEQTCSHVVVMHAGKVLVAGAVSDLGVAGDRHLEEVFLETIAGAAGLTSRPDEDPEARGERLRQVRAR